MSQDHRQHRGYKSKRQHHSQHRIYSANHNNESYQHHQSNIPHHQHSQYYDSQQYQHSDNNAYNDNYSYYHHQPVHNHPQPSHQYYAQYHTQHATEELKHDPSPTIATFDTTAVLHPHQSNETTKKPNIALRHLLCYHTDPTNSLLEFNEAIKPIQIHSQNISALTNIDLNHIPIDYSTVKNRHTAYYKQNPYSLAQGQPPRHCWDTTRIDPFCREIQIIDKQIVRSYYQQHARFITYRHNLRAIANVVLFKLINLRIHDKCGINIGVHWNGNDIILENITEFDANQEKQYFGANCVYGYLLEHTLESLSMTNKNQKGIEPMNYQRKCLDRDEIRALNEMQIGDDVTVLLAGEMDAMMKFPNEIKHRMIELKSSKIQTGYWRSQSKIPDIANWKLLKYWTQCFFGGVDAVAIGFHREGIIQKTQVIRTQEIEAMFPVITKKCVQMVHQVLKWLQNTMPTLTQNKLYLLKFDTSDGHNTQFVLKHLSAKNTETRVFQMLASADRKAKDVLGMGNHGLIINPRTKQLELKQIL
eukprot:392284_1